jgi:hypothetical protein
MSYENNSVFVYCFNIYIGTVIGKLPVPYTASLPYSRVCIVVTNSLTEH